MLSFWSPASFALSSLHVDIHDLLPGELIYFWLFKGVWCLLERGHILGMGHVKYLDEKIIETVTLTSVLIQVNSTVSRTFACQFHVNNFNISLK